VKERSRRLRGWIIEDTIRVTCVTLVFGKLYERNVQERNIRWRIVLLVNTSLRTVFISDAFPYSLPDCLWFF